MKDLAPVVLFTYKRLDTLKNTISALKKNRLAAYSDVFIFSDAAKQEKDADIVSEVRHYIKSITGFKSVTIYEARVNKGLALSIISGVSEVCKRFEKVIVLEDDLITNPNFLTYMNSALDFYADNKAVFSISGYNYNFDVNDEDQYDNYFVSRGCSWGWATWSDRWENIDWDMHNYTGIESVEFKKSFNLSGSDLTDMLLKQKSGAIDSWAIRWYYNQFMRNGLTCYPKLSLVDNQGFDENATHTRVFNRYRTELESPEKELFAFNPLAEINSRYQKLIQWKFSIFTRIFWGRGMTYLMKLGLTK